MAAYAVGRGHLFYDLGKTLPIRDVRQLKTLVMGRTQEGFEIIHFEFEFQNKVVSYDTVYENGLYYFIHGSGRTKFENGSVSAWQWGNTTSGEDCQGKRFHQLTGA